MSVLKSCPYCGGHGYINQFEDIEGGCRAWSKTCIACKGTGAILVPETNADRIRRMSDEELAAFLERVHENPCDACCGNWGQCCRNNAPEPVCKNHFLEWLQQPAEEGT